jgi:hypothetical protein
MAVEAPQLKAYRGVKVGINDRNTQQKDSSMKRQFDSTILRCGLSLLTCCLLANSPTLHAQEFIISGTVPAGGGKHTFRAGSGFGLVINGSDIGTILLGTCDLNQNGNVTLPELKQVAAACFKLWDTNTDGSVSGTELSTAIKELLPAPPVGVHGIRVVHGVAVEVTPDELPTPDKQLTKRILAGADSNKDDTLTFQEVSTFLLGKCFSQWDLDGNGSLDSQELNEAFGQLAKPE